MGKWGERKERVCECCGKVDTVMPSDKSRFCSRACRDSAHAKPIYTCLKCGKQFKPGRGENRGMYCSRECSFAAARERGLAKAKQKREARAAASLRICKCCGREYKAQSGCYCSDACRREIARGKYQVSKERVLKRMRDEYVPIPSTVRVCIVCGKSFLSNKGRACSSQCTDALRNARKHRHRARIYGVAYQPVNPRAIFARDGWICQICGRKTPERLRGSLRDNAPELDHRVPISKGGGHTYDNVQCACRRCNGVKSNTNNAGQLPLFNDIRHLHGGQGKCL